MQHSANVLRQKEEEKRGINELLQHDISKYQNDDQKQRELLLAQNRALMSLEDDKDHLLEAYAKEATQFEPAVSPRN